MDVPGNNCGTPVQNLIYESESCFFSQGRDVKNASSTSVLGVPIFDSKVNDYLFFRPLRSSDGSVSITYDSINKVVDITGGGVADVAPNFSLMLMGG